MLYRLALLISDMQRAAVGAVERGERGEVE